MDRRIAALDGLRGAAIAYVIMGHFGPHWLRPAGSFGVAVFFALSGRLMADVLFINNMGWQEFAIRRVARLYPALLFFVACVLAFSCAPGRKEFFVDWWCYPLFAVNLVVVFAGRFPPFDHLWSVSVEVQAYVMLVIIATCLSGRMRLTVLLAGALFGLASGLLRTYVGHQNPFQVYWRPDVQMAVIFGAAFLRLQLQDVCLPTWLTPLAFAMSNALMLTTTEPWVSASVNGVLLAFVGATAERASLPFVQLLESRPLIFLGTISYSLYIWQQLFKYSHDAGFPVLGALSLSLIIATISHYRIERPGKTAILSLWRGLRTRNAPRSP